MWLCSSGSCMDGPRLVVPWLIPGALYRVVRRAAAWVDRFHYPATSPFFQSKNLRVLHLDEDVAAVVLDSASGKTNALTPAFVAELDEALGRVALDGRFR